jgi:hypothetical protein
MKQQNASPVKYTIAPSKSLVDSRQIADGMDQLYVPLKIKLPMSPGILDQIAK